MVALRSLNWIDQPGSSVTMAFGEVVPALQNKMVDCAITGSLSGYSAKWYEVSTHLYTLPINWNPQIHAVNRKAWDKLDPKVQTFVQTNIKAMINNMWDAAAAQTQQGYDCNTGAAGCTLPVRGKMVLVRPSDADRALLKKLMQETVLPKWAARCSAGCVQDFNATIGKIVHLTAKK